ncbi:phytanoyl-CoA dioxygenase family protein [Vibrio penaeicida]|uniref:Phytanoyl-CoA dioxygenase n=1 Tax=Vibrio penaeicida TaxID=104609 RepID=A0AAV5NXV5_9VIBR|nr:phytanoyl-CoA dioxygenase family protein [Vibrio penaeicida]RTZ23511.1 phytanoyl-CoA dioxygenase family protein [Vibrio penaeicida]GLQ75275.1 phytanoyl-CoA dioxygenase [Vibrio penaeicida]
MLSQQQVLQYHEQGYLVLDQMIPVETLNELKQRAAKIVDEWKPDITTSIFTTNDNDRTGDSYFLDSAEKVRCFFEEEAFDKNGQLIEQKALCINKIGHALHELDPVFREFSHLPVLGDIANDIGVDEPEIRQSMYIFKQPKIGGVVNWHQDATFFFTTPQSVVTYWFAIEDATLENGCLWVEPKGHTGPLRERFNRDGDNIEMVKLDDTPWPTEKSGIPVEVKAGSLVIFQGLLPHYSAPNRSAKSRQAFTLHVTDGSTHYAKENWLQTILLPLRGFD